MLGSAYVYKLWVLGMYTDSPGPLYKYTYKIMLLLLNSKGSTWIYICADIVYVLINVEGKIRRRRINIF